MGRGWAAWSIGRLRWAKPEVWGAGQDVLSHKGRGGVCASGARPGEALYRSSAVVQEPSAASPLLDGLELPKDNGAGQPRPQVSAHSEANPHLQTAVVLLAALEDQGVYLCVGSSNSARDCGGVADRWLSSSGGSLGCCQLQLVLQANAPSTAAASSRFLSTPGSCLRLKLSLGGDSSMSFYSAGARCMLGREAALGGPAITGQHSCT
mmetsp:Transcript_2007/g.5925  ORF Transcript_2007/g.5925 Transcript_2007/m.5925 type:complete len:208 (+) Transcript_2007:295-918(+)